MVHERLESGWSVAEPKEHDGGFKESERSDECSFPLVLFANATVVESPSYVEPGKDRGVFHVVNQFRNKRQGVCIANSMGVQVLVVLARMERTIFLCYKEKRGSLWGFGQDNSSGLKVFIDEGLACFLFLWVERVYFSDLGNERGLKVNSVVIGSVGRKNVVGLLREHIVEVRTPIRNFLVGSLCHLGEFGGQRDLIEMFAIEILLREVLTKRHIVLRRISLGEERRKFHVRVTSKPAEQVSLGG